MFKRLFPFLLLFVAVAAGILFALRAPPEGPSVTLYCAVDDDVAREAVARFTAEKNIRVEFVGDTEAAKSIGLALRLKEEGKPGGVPHADVYWNNEPLWSQHLAEAGILEAYASPAAADIPAEWKDPQGRWTAVGLRARVFIVNVPAVAAGKPSTFRDLAAPAWKGKGGMARPLAGTTLSHMAALRGMLGAAPFETWFRAVVANDSSFASGNGSMAQDVGKGGRAFGFTDTDDCAARKAAGEPVDRVFPDQAEGEIGAFVLPVTVSLVRGAPHPKNARILIDWLLSAENEARLSASPYATIPVRPGTKPGPDVADLKTFRRATVNWSEAAKNVDAILDLTKAVMEGK
jgi:iron(III) transport system substrate-binding protein